VIRIADRKNADHLAIKSNATGIHYPIIHLQPAYTDLGYRKGDFPLTEEQAEQILSLPMYAELTEDMIGYAAEIIQESVS
jgi:dTDP-4-amino-4,6-dideoxygalactose transaminase